MKAVPLESEDMPFGHIIDFISGKVDLIEDADLRSKNVEMKTDLGTF
jgi:hypothetical protein